jgi:hypothetical protein
MITTDGQKFPTRNFQVRNQISEPREVYIGREEGIRGDWFRDERREYYDRTRYFCGNVISSPSLILLQSFQKT